MTGCTKSAVSSHSPHRNPLIDITHRRSCSASADAVVVSLGTQIRQNLSLIGNNKENASPNPAKSNHNRREIDEKLKDASIVKSRVKHTSLNSLKQSSLQVCMKKNELDSSLGLKIWDLYDSEIPNSGNMWDFSDSEAAPASSWSNLPNRSLLCRPLPLDVGRCTCIVVKESSPDGFDGGALYTLYTNEGKGRQNRKLAVARHRRRRGRSEFTIAQNPEGITAPSADSLVGTMTANIVGSKYHIWDQGHCLKTLTTRHHPKLLASVRFAPTVSTWTGNYRMMRAWIPKHQSMQLKSANQIQHMNGLPTEWEGGSKDRVHQLFSKVPSYNKFTKQHELDFRDRGRAGAGLKIQRSVKNFQLIVDRNGKQTILQLGKVGKNRYVMDYRYPMTGYQAFCICLASMDSKLCCSV